MSKTVDDRVVRMSFDTNKFQHGVKGVLDGLKNIDKSLDNERKFKGLDSISKGINNITRSGMNDLNRSVDEVSKKFSIMEITGVTALVNITNRAVSAGTNLVKSLTLDPITDGFREYELKMNSIQTILTNTKSKGTTLDDVNVALSELNEYSDKTIYNFAQMTDNIGKATSAGVGLKDAVTFVKGMANVAAGFGVDAMSMAGATQQMTQALASGTIRLQDWMSMEHRGMGGEMIQKALKQTAKEMGIYVNDSKAFRYTLEDNWLSSEVFIKTMEKMANDDSLVSAAQNVTSFTKLLDTMKEAVGSGWATTFEHIFGNKEDSTKLFTDISNAFNDLIGPSADARNGMLEFWNEAGGRADIIKGVTNIIQSIGKAVSSVSSAFKDIFPPITGKQLVGISKGFLDLTEKLKLSDSAAKNISKVFKGVFSIIKSGLSIVTSFGKVLSPIGDIVGVVGGVLLDFLGSIGDFASYIGDAANQSKIFTGVADGITAAFEFVSKIIRDVISAIGDLGTTISNINFEPVTNFVSTIADGVGNGLSKMSEGFSNFMSNIDLGSVFGVLAALFAGKSLGLFSTISDTISDALGGAFSALTGVSDSVSDILDNVGNSLAAYQNNLNAGTIIKISAAIALLAGALILLGNLDSKQLEVGLTGIAFLFAELLVGLKVLLTIITGKKLAGLIKASTALVILSSAILILSAALKSISSLSWDELTIGLVGVIGLIGGLVLASKFLDKNSKGIVRTATGLLVLSAALNAMTGAVRSLSSLNESELKKGLVSVGILLAELALFMKLTKLSGMGVMSSVGILILASSLNVLTGAVRSLANVKVENIKKSLATIGILLAELAIFTKLTSGSKGMLTTSAGMILLATALNIMTGAIRSLANLKVEQLEKSLFALAGSLAIFAVATKLISGGKLILISTGLVIMSTALSILDGVLKNLGSMKDDELGRSLVALAGSLLIFAGAMALMSGGIFGAMAMGVMTAALALFTPQLMLLSQLSLEQLGVGLLALAGTFTILGLAGLLLGPLTPILLALAGTVALLGIGTTVAGAGVALFAAGLATLATVGAAGVLVITSLIENIINLIPLFALKLIEGFTNIVTSFAENTPKIVTAVANMLISVLTTIASETPKITEAGFNMIMALLDGINKYVDPVVGKMVEILVTMASALLDNAVILIDAGIELIINFINGIAEGISSNSDAFSEAFNNLIFSVLDALVGFSVDFFKSGVGFVSELIGGIFGKEKEIKKTSKDVAESGVDGVETTKPQWQSAGKELSSGIEIGISSGRSGVMRTATSLARDAANAIKKELDINSPSRVTTKFGRYTSEGLAVGITRFGILAESAGRQVAEDTANSIERPMNNIALLDGINVDPVVRPVLDLSNIRNGSRTIGDMLHNAAGSISSFGSINGRLVTNVGTIQNGKDNSDIVTAISKLRKDISNIQGTTNIIEGITYDDGSAISNTLGDLVRMARVERRK